MKFIKKHKGKIFILMFILFTAFTIYDTYSMENINKAEVKTEPEVTKKESKGHVPSFAQLIGHAVPDPGGHPLPRGQRRSPRHSAFFSEGPWGRTQEGRRRAWARPRG